jgi:hypothetical protein
MGFRIGRARCPRRAANGEAFAYQREFENQRSRSNRARFPLTPALSLGERGNRSPTVGFVIRHS